MEKFVIKDLPSAEENEEGALEFQVYSSHHVSRRHLVGVASVRLADVDKLTSGQVELLVTPQTVYRVSTDVRSRCCPVSSPLLPDVREISSNIPPTRLACTSFT